MINIAKNLRHREGDAAELVNDLEGLELELQVLLEEKDMMQQGMNATRQTVQKTEDKIHIKLLKAISENSLHKREENVSDSLSPAQRKKVTEAIEEQNERITDLLVEMETCFMALTDKAMESEIKANQQLLNRLKGCYDFYQKNLAQANKRITMIELSSLKEK